MEQRRNYHQRAKVVRVVIDRLAHYDDAITIGQIAEVHPPLPVSAAERIVKHLAIRGLVRQPCAGTWEAAPPLRQPAQLIIDTANDHRDAAEPDSWASTSCTVATG
jgi:hypothetical protein